MLNRKRTTQSALYLGTDAYDADQVALGQATHAGAVTGVWLPIGPGYTHHMLINCTLCVLQLQQLSVLHSS